MTSYAPDVAPSVSSSTELFEFYVCPFMSDLSPDDVSQVIEKIKARSEVNEVLYEPRPQSSSLFKIICLKGSENLVDYQIRNIVRDIVQEPEDNVREDGRFWLHGRGSFGKLALVNLDTVPSSWWDKIEEKKKKSTTQKALAENSKPIKPTYRSEDFDEWQYPSDIFQMPYRAIWRELENVSYRLHSQGTGANIQDLMDAASDGEGAIHNELEKQLGCRITWNLRLKAVYIGADSKEQVSKAIEILNQKLHTFKLKATSVVHLFFPEYYEDPWIVVKHISDTGLFATTLVDVRPDLARSEYNDMLEEGVVLSLNHRGSAPPVNPKRLPEDKSIISKSEPWSVFRDYQYTKKQGTSTIATFKKKAELPQPEAHAKDVKDWIAKTADCMHISPSSSSSSSADALKGRTYAEALSGESQRPLSSAPVRSLATATKVSKSRFSSAVKLISFGSFGSLGSLQDLDAGRVGRAQLGSNGGQRQTVFAETSQNRLESDADASAAMMPPFKSVKAAGSADVPSDEVFVPGMSGSASASVSDSGGAGAVIRDEPEQFDRQSLVPESEVFQPRGKTRPGKLRGNAVLEEKKKESAESPPSEPAKDVDGISEDEIFKPRKKNKSHTKARPPFVADSPRKEPNTTVIDGPGVPRNQNHMLGGEGVDVPALSSDLTLDLAGPSLPLVSLLDEDDDEYLRSPDFNWDANVLKPVLLDKDKEETSSRKYHETMKNKVNRKSNIQKKSSTTVSPAGLGRHGNQSKEKNPSPLGQGNRSSPAPAPAAAATEVPGTCRPTLGPPYGGPSTAATKSAPAPFSAVKGTIMRPILPAARKPNIKVESEEGDPLSAFATASNNWKLETKRAIIESVTSRSNFNAAARRVLHDLGRMMSTLGGHVRLRVQFGRVVLRKPDSATFSPDRPKLMEPKVVLKDLNSHTLVESTTFHQMLSVFGADADALARASGGGWVLSKPDSKVVYDFAVRDETDAKKTYVLNVDAQTFEIKYGEAEEEVGVAYVHCLQRPWDFKLSVSQAKTTRRKEVEELARHVARSLTVQHKDGKLAFGVEQAGAAAGGLYVADVRIRHVARYRNDGRGQNWLDVTMVTRTVRSEVSDNSVFQAECLEGAEDSEPYFGVPTTWYEASVSSVAAEDMLRRNADLVDGQKASWTVEEMEKAGAFDALLGCGIGMIGRIDLVGCHNDNQQARRYDNEEKQPYW